MSWVVPVKCYFVPKIPAPKLKIFIVVRVTDQKIELVGQVEQPFFLLGLDNLLRCY